MNDETTCKHDQNPLPAESGNSLSEEDAEATETRATNVAKDQENLGDDCCDGQEDPRETGISENALPDSDPVDPEPLETIATRELEQLRSELTSLRAELAEKTTFWERLGMECEEFQTLYPETPISSISDSVWKDVNRGIPLAAAYALAERKRTLTAAMAEKQNRENQARSSGAIRSPENDFFSPNEVRAMSSAEVHQNYAKIMKSMQKWH